MYNKLIDYFKGTRAELAQVNWPSRKQTTNFTLLVIGVSVSVAFFLGLFDRLFELLINKIIL